MFIASAALKRDRLTLVATVLVVLGGLIAYESYPSQEEPTIPVNEAVVRVLHPGLNAERMEELVVRPLERGLRDLPEAKQSASTVRAGFAQIRYEIQDGTASYDLAWQKLREKVAEIRRVLPEGTLGPFVDDDFGRVAVATIALTAPGHEWRDVRRQVRTLQDQLAALPGAGRVSVHGLIEEQIRIDIRPAKIAGLGRSADGLEALLRQQNAILPGGRVTVGGIEAAIDPQGSFRSPEDIEGLRLGLPSGGTVRFGDFASVTRAPVEPLETAAFLNGERAVVLAVSMRASSNVIDFTRMLRERLPRLEASMPAGFKLLLITDQGEVTANVISDMVENLLQTVAVVLAVTVLALGFRGGLIVGATVPLTMLASLLILRALEIDLNMVSTAAFIIALGILVDNANVVVDEIRWRTQNGEAAKQATLQAATKLAAPLLIATLTTILAFAPPILADNLVAIYMQVLTVVMTVTLLVSWLIAITVTPLLARVAMSGTGASASRVRAASPLATKFFGAILDRPISSILAVVVMLLGSLLLSPLIPNGFLPSSNRAQLQIPLEAAPGTSASHMANRTAEVSRFLSNEGEFPDITSSLAYVGEGGPRFILGLNPPDPAPHRAYLVVNVREGTNIPLLADQLRTKLGLSFPDLLAEPKPFSLGTTDAGQAIIRIAGGSESELRAHADNVAAAFRNVPGTIDVRHDWEQRVYRIVVVLDEARARRVGASVTSIAEALSGITDGGEISVVHDGEQQIPLIWRGEARERTASRLLDVPVALENGSAVPLSEVADLKLSSEPSVIQKHNARLAISITARNPSLTADELVRSIEPTLASLPKTETLSWEVDGEIKENEVATNAVFQYMPLCVLMIVILFFWQFNSFRKVAIVTATIPFCLSGVILALVIFQAPFDFMSNLGLFALIGTIVSNGILVIEQIEEEQRLGLGLRQAIEAACNKRLRPIIITQATTILGLLPLLLSREPLWLSFNLVVMGGLTAGTIASLVMVPALYLVAFREADRRA